MNTVPRFFGREPMATWPGGAMVAVLCALFLAGLILADRTTPEPVTLGSLALIVALAAGFLLKPRLLVAVLIIGVLSRLVSVGLAGLNPVTGIAQSITFLVGGAVAYLAAEALRDGRKQSEATQRLANIVSVTTELAAASLSPSDLVADLLAYSVVTTGADRGDVARIEGDDLIIEAAYDSGGSPIEIGSRRKVDERPVLKEMFEIKRPVRAKPALVFPLLVEGNVHGVLTLISRNASAFADAEVAAVEQVATITALALHGSRLYRETEAAAARLRESERALAESQALVQVGSWRWDLVQNRILWSDQMWRIFGLAPAADGPSYEEYLTYVHPDDRELAKTTIDDSLREAKPFAFDHRIIRPDGVERMLQAHGTVEADGSGRAAIMSGTVQDITERNQAEGLVQRMTMERENELREHARRMEALEKVKSEFLLLASHELRGPLSVLTGYISLMQDGALGVLPERARNAVHTMAERANAMTRLTEELLQTARLEHGLQLDLRPLDLRDVATEAVQEASAAGHKGHRIGLQVSTEAVLVLGDRDRLVIILNGLLDNAIKYSRSGTDIACDVSAEADWGSVSVRDKGPGIKSEDLPKLFTRFGRIDNPENAHIPGAGLGLYLAQNLARMHGGRITVESEPGKGSTFALRLPLAPIAQETEPRPETPSARATR